MLDFTDDEMVATIERIQSEIPEFQGLSRERQVAITSIAKLTTKSVLELFQRKSKGVISLDLRSPFPTVFAEWAQQFVLKTHFDRYLAIMLYLRDYESTSIVTTSDVARMYDKSRWKKPANLADVFSKGAERIYFIDIESEEGLKQWQITRSGYDHLMSLKTEV